VNLWRKTLSLGDSSKAKKRRIELKWKRQKQKQEELPKKRLQTIIFKADQFPITSLFIHRTGFRSVDNGV
jgi:hypothetical protein